MNVTTIPLITDLQESTAGSWKTLQVRFTDVGPQTVIDVYPFLTVNDLKRLIWMQRDGDPRWSPERTFLGVRSAIGIRPIEFTWPASVTGGHIDLQDPTKHREPNPALVDETGIRKPVNPTMIGGLVLETALSPEILSTGAIPEIDAISLDDLRLEGSISDAIYGGYYQYYFPWLTAPGQVLEPNKGLLKESYAAAVPYSEDRTARIGLVNRALRGRIAGEAAFLETFVKLRWVLPLPPSKPESLEKTFYGLQASVTLPFLRYFPPKSTGQGPLLKIGLNSDGTPVISDPKIFASYLGQPAPNSSSAVVVARSPLNSEYAPGAAFTIHLFEDGTSDVSLEVPQRGATFIAAVAAEAQRVLKRLTTILGYPDSMEPSLRDIHATYKWSHPNAKKAKPLSAARLQARVAGLTPFLEAVPRVEGDKALAAFQWRATSNYESESSQFQYITQLVLRGKDAPLETYLAAIQSRFGVTEVVAKATMERWLEKRADAVTPASGSSVSVAKHSAGASVAIYAAHPEYRMEIQGVESGIELQRVLSVVGVLLGASDSELSLSTPVPAVQAVAAVVALQDAAVAATGPEEVEEGDLGDFGDLLADLGFGGDQEADQEETGEAGTEAPLVEAPAEVALPDLTAAVAAVEDECGANPLPAGTVLDIAPDWYMVKLKRNDTVMFGFPATKTGRVKTYSKSCQRRDDRQPNIMTLTEYARVKNCYQDMIRFVDLPPQKPTDLPNDPTFSAKRKYPDEYYLYDPETKRPMWTVYGYENKTRPGEFLYLMCSELWCEYDNLPLLREEFMGTNGRGFKKPEKSCPFCGGRVIVNMSSPKAGETVVARGGKGKEDKIHSFIGTITRNTHPNGYGLPCCDLTPRLLKHYMGLAVTGKLGLTTKVPAIAEEAEEDFAEPLPDEADVVDVLDERRIDYRGILKSMQTQYILGNDKALEAGKIGLLTPALDGFFGQNGARALKAQGIRPTFDDLTYLFVRVGVDTQVQRSRRGLNLFAGLAPLLGMENASQVLRLFLGQRNPVRNEAPDEALARRLVRTFEMANYGALMMEFAAKSQEAVTQGVLEDFARRNGYTLGPARAHVTRLYRAWTAFLQYLVDPAQPKQIRHFEHMLAQPGPISPRGRHLIVLEQDGEGIRIVCPSFGIPTAAFFGNVPISFMWHDVRDDSWEPLILYNGTKDAVVSFGERSPDLASLPPTLLANLSELLRTWHSLTGCARPGPPPHVWTPNLDTAALPRLSSLARKIGGFAPTSMVRDRSNRLAGLVFSNGCFIPCLDDGFITEQLARLYEAEMIPATSLATYLDFYGTVAKEYKGLTPRALLVRDARIVGFRTDVGTMVPVAAEAVGAASLPIEQLDIFPWDRDNLVLKAPDASTATLISFEESTASLEEQVAEAFQHVRLSFSRWLNRDAKGPTMRRNIATILKSSVPLFEKRKRMDILLQPKLQEWIMEGPAEDAGRVTLPLLREDCLSLPEEACKGACSWGGGRCLIHVPASASGASKSLIFTARISDELLRYAQKRIEILEDHVPTIRAPKGSLRVGNELYMATKPKESADDVMGRVGFSAMTVQFPEELMRFEGAEDEVMDVGAMGPDWAYKGFSEPNAEGLEDPRGLMFAGVTGKTLDEWTALLDKKRGSAKALQWSPADLQLISNIMVSNLLFVIGPSIVAWYAPQGPLVAKIGPLYSIFWGPQQLLLHKGVDYRFKIGDLPASLLRALDAASPEASASAPVLASAPVTALVAAPVSAAAPAPASAPVAAPVTGPIAASAPALVPSSAIVPAMAVVEAVVSPEAPSLLSAAGSLLTSLITDVSATVAPPSPPEEASAPSDTPSESESSAPSDATPPSSESEASAPSETPSESSEPELDLEVGDEEVPELNG